MKIAVIGGGFAGISAVHHLSDKYPDCRVSLFEKNDFLGGRWYSFYSKKNDTVIDNGTHLLSASYDETFKILRAYGAENLFSDSDALSVLFKEDGKEIPFDTGKYFGGLGQLMAILEMSVFSIKDKISFIKFVLFLSLVNPDKYNSSAQDLLIKHKQSENCIKYFWEPFNVSAFNAEAKDIPASIFLRTLKLGFFGKKSESGLIACKTNISDVFKEIESVIQTKNIDIHKNTKVLNIEKEGEKLRVETKEENYYFDKIIFTLPPYMIKKVISPDLLGNELDVISDIKYNPILTVCITTDRKLFTFPFVAIIGGVVQWLFPKNYKLEEGVYAYDCLVSDAQSLINLNANRVVELVQKDLDINFGKCNILNYHIIRENKATIRLENNILSKLPKQGYNKNNIYFAGDWLYSGLPATIEAATMSGRVAVERI